MARIPRKKRVMHEEVVQRAIISFLRSLRKMGIPIQFVHPANELMRTSTLRKIYWYLGVEAGVPDLIIFLRGGKTIFIELKVAPNGLSEDQMKWENNLCDMGFEHHIVTAPNSSMQGKAIAVHAVAEILNKHGLKV